MSLLADFQGKTAQIIKYLISETTPGNVSYELCDGKCVSFADEIVALKRLKMEKEKEGFPITSLREINTILKAQHLNIVTVRVRL